VKGGFDSMYGPIGNEWNVTSEGTDIAFTIPANLTATFVLPVEKMDDLKIVTGKKGVASKKYSDGKAVYQLKSGKYSFKNK
jgi:S1-C subfamily serine protease